MPIHFKIDPEKKHINVDVVGDFTLAEALAAFHAVTDHPQFGSDFTLLANHTRIGQVMNTEEVRSLASEVASIAQRVRGMRWAMVAPKPASFGTGRMLSAYLATIPVHLEVFSDVESAQAWLHGEAEA